MKHKQWILILDSKTPYNNSRNLSISLDRRFTYFKHHTFCHSIAGKETICRLQRSFRECLLIDDLIQKDVIEVHFYKEGFVLNKNSSSTDILRWDMSVLFAKSYVSALSENVKRGNRYALESGQYPGKPPIGYQKVLLENGKPTFILDKTRAYLIKKIFELYSEGIYSLADLVKQCEEWNLTSNKSIKGKPLCKNTIDRIKNMTQ